MANIKAVAADITESFIKDLQQQITKQVNADVAHKLSLIDINQTVRQCVDLSIQKRLSDFSFPRGSIPGTAIDISTLRLVGENIFGGIHQNFCSTGIQDTASDCKVTILDHATVIENVLVAAAAEIKGKLIVDGDLEIAGEIPPDSQFYTDIVDHAAGKVMLALNDDFFKKFSQTVFAQIREQGIDLNKLTLNGEPLVDGNSLAKRVTESHLRSVGNLKTLVVDGDTTLNQETLNIGIRRVGVNTTEPKAAFEVWDDECEFLVQKQRKDTLEIGTTRPHQVVISSNGKGNLIINPDGGITVEKITVGKTDMTSALTRPTYTAPRGTIVWNNAADVGQPIGWVNVGGANWGSFGTIS